MKKIFSIFKNKFLLTIILLGVWVALFDKNDIATQWELKQEVKTLQAERNYFANEIRDISSNLRELNTNPLTLEKFAREKYLMKRENEDVFILVNDTSLAPTASDKK
jgi:cell division protein FtsB